MLREPTPMRSNVAEDSTGLAELADTAMLPFGPFFVLPSGWGVIAMWPHPICTTTTIIACLSSLRVLPRSFAG